MNKQIVELEERIRRIKAALQEIGDIRPGVLSRQGPSGKEYYQVSYTHKMRSRTEYVRTASVARVKKEIQAYKRFKALTQKWIDLALELSKIRGKEGL